MSRNDSKTKRRRADWLLRYFLDIYDNVKAPYTARNFRTVANLTRQHLGSSRKRQA